ncbi:hypothetical protein CONCODRAFT_2704 [Conidiobolus coronatus NRRL 28638]|uniref:Uncharacterized protein n=1 Tax=Conidiobolus coronatus (strain ATCC 28846 / CBS 209.66 / NRRL 28638) TaxID=796925 RepID=A0A137PH37_CONC2|nr:hypothetical protein CONCODRAFT_2704 [Conidiobolus coronatus NRRL 28638]|eukprot:KXN74319.1 hypothetical protein CONCODRAFT_2704 [Conidiobolus coronatus NRRL 28638]
MLKEFKNLVISITQWDIKADIELLSGVITVPELTEEYSQFSVQGNLMLESLMAKSIKKISIQLNGTLDSCMDSKLENQKLSIIDNQLELITEPIDIPIGCSVFGFELLLPRSLPTSVSSKDFKLKYTLKALVIFEDDTKFTKKITPKVYNNYLLPHREKRQSSYENSGTIMDLIDWEIKFPTRLFSLGESVNFEFSLKPKDGVAVGIVIGKLFQLALVYKNSSDKDNNEEEDLEPTKQLISQDMVYIARKTSHNTIGLNLPTSIRSPITLKPSTVQTMKTQYFEVAHKIQIQVEYVILGSDSAYICNIPIPVGITSNESALDELEFLPSYDNSTLNSPCSEYMCLSPVYSS